MPPLPKSDSPSTGKALPSVNGPISRIQIGQPSPDEVRSPRSVYDDREGTPTAVGKEHQHHGHRHGRKTPVSFFEDADTLAKIIAKNEATGGAPTRKMRVCVVKPNSKIRKSLLGNQLNDVSPSAPQEPLIEMLSPGKAEMDATVKAWRYNEVKEHFRQAYEKQQGRKLYEGKFELASD